MSTRPPAGRRSPLPPPPPEFPELASRSPIRYVVLGIVALALIVGCGAGALTVQADISQPVASGKVACQVFTVTPGESASDIIDRLEQAHLIRNAMIFKFYLKLRGQSLNVQQGRYCLSPSMTPSDIASALNTAPNAAYVQFTVPEGDRLLQYPGDILSTAVLHDPGQSDDGAKGPKALPSFNAGDFLNIAIKTGTFPGSSQYWYVKPWATGSGKALAALEGYLSPNTYYVDPKSNATDIVKTMLNGLGEYLCPGPSGNLDQYILDQAQCKQHQAVITPPTMPQGIHANVGKPIGVFDALNAKHVSLPQAIILASLAQREARTPPNFFLVDSTYYNRWTITNSDPSGFLGADPAEQYWLGQSGNNPWPDLPDTPKNLANNPFNLYLTPGLPPSAIAGPGQSALYGAIDIIGTNYRWFFYGCDHQNHYYTDGNTFTNDQNRIGVPGAQC